MWTYHRVEMLRWLYTLSPSNIFTYDKQFTSDFLDHAYCYKHLIRAWKEFKKMKYAELW